MRIKNNYLVVMVSFLTVFGIILFGRTINFSKFAKSFGIISPIVVCVGDSLVSGDYSPYPSPTNNFTKELSERFPELDVINLGISGEITPQMVDRRGNADRYKPFRIIIWGGVNDIAQDASAKTIEKNLQKLYTYYSKEGYEVWAITIDPVDNDTDTHNSVRNIVNEWVKNDSKGVSKIIDAWTIIRDPDNPGNRLPAYADPNLNVHINNAGFAAIVSSIEKQNYKIVYLRINEKKMAIRSVTLFIFATFLVSIL